MPHSAPTCEAKSVGPGHGGPRARGRARHGRDQATRPEYALLGTWLATRLDRETQLTFEEIEKIIGGALPPSARSHRSWWGNDETHSHAKSWLSRGFFVTALSLLDETVRFQFSRRLLELRTANAICDTLTSLGAPKFPHIPVSVAKTRVQTLRRDRLAFEAMREGLRRAGSVQIAFHAHVHEPPQRGRRTETGYGTILVYDRHRPTFSPMWMTFEGGEVTIVRALGKKSLGSISTWPEPRRLSGLQFVGLWQLKPRFLVAWPSAEWMQSDEVQLLGAFTLPRHVTPHECLRACTWVLREADAFENGFRKVLFRKRAIYPMRALRLADTYLARYVKPPFSLARSLYRLWPMDPILFFGADESPFDPMLEAFGHQTAGL